MIELVHKRSDFAELKRPMVIVRYGGKHILTSVYTDETKYACEESIEFLGRVKSYISEAI